MKRRGYLLQRAYWRNRIYPHLTRYVIRPSVDFRGLPLVAITGTSGKTSTTLLVERILRDAGYSTACSSSEGVMVKGNWVKRGDEAGAKGLWRASRSRGVEVLVAETARGGIVRNGLAFSSCDVSVVTSLYEDHLSAGRVASVEEMAEVKSILPRSTRPNGTAVLNLDHPLIRGMAERTRARVVFFSLSDPPDAVENCFFLRDGTIFRKRGAVREPLLSTDAIFISHGGAVTFQVANAMAAMAAIEGLQTKLPVARSSLERTLAAFGREPTDLPLRFQLFHYRGADILLCDTKNPASYELEVPLIRRLIRAHGYRRIVGVVTDVGNRAEDRYHQISRAVASVADLVVCVPPLEKYLRGRTADEMVRLLGSEVPAEKLVHPLDPSLDGVLEHFRQDGYERTLFVGFASQHFGADTTDDILERGERLPIRFDP
jgi:cyanophycin synthetase